MGNIQHVDADPEQHLIGRKPFLQTLGSRFLFAGVGVLFAGAGYARLVGPEGWTPYVIGGAFALAFAIASVGWVLGIEEFTFRIWTYVFRAHLFVLPTVIGAIAASFMAPLWVALALVIVGLLGISVGIYPPWQAVARARAEREEEARRRQQLAQPTPAG